MVAAGPYHLVALARVLLQGKHKLTFKLKLIILMGNVQAIVDAGILLRVGKLIQESNIESTLNAACWTLGKLGAGSRGSSAVQVCFGSFCTSPPVKSCCRLQLLDGPHMS